MLLGVIFTSSRIKFVYYTEEKIETETARNVYQDEKQRREQGHCSAEQNSR